MSHGTFNAMTIKAKQEQRRQTKRGFDRSDSSFLARTWKSQRLEEASSVSDGQFGKYITHTN